MAQPYVVLQGKGAMEALKAAGLPVTPTVVKPAGGAGAGGKAKWVSGSGKGSKAGGGGAKPGGHRPPKPPPRR